MQVFFVEKSFRNLSIFFTKRHLPLPKGGFLFCKDNSQIVQFNMPSSPPHPSASLTPSQMGSPNSLLFGV